jgi:hypothetical protein
MAIPKAIQDDRGATLPLAPPSEMVGVARAADGDAAAAEVYRRLEGGRWFVRAIVGVYLLWLGAKLAADLVGGRLSLVRFGMGLVVLALLVWLLTRRSNWLQRRPPAAVRSIMLGMGRCPACGYSLIGLAPAGDGMTVCSECGGAWKGGPVAHAPGS